MGQKLPVVNARQFVRAMQRCGFVVVPRRGKGSHIVLRRESDKCKLTVPNHDPIKPGTLRSLIDAAGLTIEEFRRLL